MSALQDVAEQALALMRAQGFDHAQAGASVTRLDELNIAHDAPSLLRGVETRKLALAGLVDGRKASTELGDFSADALRERVAGLFAEAMSAPPDDANAVSAGEHARIEQGPQEGELDLLADKVAELLAFRERETPKTAIQEGAAAYTRVHSHTLTSGGSDLACRLGWYSMAAMCAARDGDAASSFNYTAGDCHDLRAQQAADWFGLGDMMRDCQRQVHTRPLDAKFVGDVVLTPPAVDDVLAWLLGQLGDVHLIAGTSLYQKRVGQQIASPLVSLRSRFDAPGVAAVSADAFAALPVELVRAGALRALAPSLYASRKTGFAHLPVAASGWEMSGGDTPLSEVLAGVRRGALVGRLSMGMPAPNGDFSGVIKNSFLLVDGELGPALSEVMISGNIAQMLRDVAAASRERLDTGARLLPWLRIANLHFS